MARQIKPMDKITQRSVGFNLRQVLFFAEHQDFKPDKFCRKVVDDQIALINPKFLSDDDERRIE